MRPLDVRGFGRSRAALPVPSPWGWALTGIGSPTDPGVLGRLPPATGVCASWSAERREDDVLRARKDGHAERSARTVRVARRCAVNAQRTRSRAFIPRDSWSAMLQNSV